MNSLLLLNKSNNAAESLLKSIYHSRILLQLGAFGSSRGVYTEIHDDGEQSKSNNAAESLLKSIYHSRMLLQLGAFGSSRGVYTEIHDDGEQSKSNNAAESLLSGILNNKGVIYHALISINISIS